MFGGKNRKLEVRKVWKQTGGHNEKRKGKKAKNGDIRKEERKRKGGK